MGWSFPRFARIGLVALSLSLWAVIHASAAQIKDEEGTVYGDITSADQICDFMESPVLTSLPELSALDPVRQREFVSEISQTLNSFLLKKVQEVGQAGRLTISLSHETKAAIGGRVAQCMQSNSATDQTVAAIDNLFRKAPFSGFDFTQIFLSEDPARLATLFFVAANAEGHELIRVSLKELEQRMGAALSAARVARDSQPSNQSDNALESAIGGQPAYAQYTCEMTGAAVYGVPNFNGSDKAVTAEITIESDGNAVINGKLVKPAKVFSAPSGTDLPFSGVVYGALDVKNALFSTEGLGTGLLNPSQDELQAFEQLKGIVQGTTDSLLARRARYLAISLANDTIFLGDVTPDGNFVNRNTPQCIRTR
ncbi:hypothetical protein NKJ93_30800 [Mesorhizobium sp. M0028]|uniref:hypothetical protein n=1 Tax=unclassified Mesorhizobium TaxID=325217 RepID=UPI00333ABC39